MTSPESVRKAADKIHLTDFSFFEDGFLVVENFLSSEEVEALRGECHRIIDEMNPNEHCTVFSTENMIADDYFMTSGDKIRFFFETQAFDEDGKLTVDKHLSLNKIGHALHVLNPEFKKVTFSEKMKSIARNLELVDPVVFQSMYILKPPRLGGIVTPHQDSTFLYTSPLRLFGYWFALEDATQENSCLWFIPGSHKDGVDENRRMIRNPDKSGPRTVFTSLPVDYEESKFVPAEVKKGSLVLIHGEVVHKSEKNESDKSRHIYAFHLYDQHQTEYSSQNWLQPTEQNTFASLYETTV